ncbi:MAG: hypothetical protein Kow0089_05350 [Desulfobulbaceae bacterium]
MFSKYDSEFWKTVVDTMQEGLMLVDPDGKIVFVNQAFEKMVGYTSDELQGRSCDVFECNRCFTARADGMSKYCALFRKKKVDSIECVFRTREGKPLHLLKNATVIRNREGEVIGGVETMIDLSRLQQKEKVIASLRRRLNDHESFRDIIGNTPAMRQVIDLASSTAQSDAPLVIYGESGTGKEILAAAIHRAGPRSEGPFIKVNCAALNANLLESELFGHVRGAFTGADYSRIGRFEAASGGSIFLDEIGDLPLSTQTKLLRVLQEKEIERVGDHRPVRIDVRVIAATNKDLRRLIREGVFREDLYYRIGVIPIHLPPLRERIEDVPLLVETFIRKIGERTGKNITAISRSAMDLLVQYSWPGNIRELINTIEYAFVLCPGGQIGKSHLPLHVRQGSANAGGMKPMAGRFDGLSPRERLVEALEMTGGNRTRAAELLGVSRVTVWKWIKKYNIRLDAMVQ